jgi:hypothetical protein
MMFIDRRIFWWFTEKPWEGGFDERPMFYGEAQFGRGIL